MADVTFDINLAPPSDQADATATLQAQLGQAAGNGVLYLHSGVYPVSASLHVSAGTRVVGYGATIKALVGAWDQTTPLIKVDGTGVTLEGLTLDCQGTSRSASGDVVEETVLITGAENVTIKNCWFKNGGSSVGLPTAPHLVIVANDSTTVYVDNGNSVPLGEIGGVTGVLVEGCRFTAGNQTFGVRALSNWDQKQAVDSFLHTVENVTIRGCRFDGEYRFNHIEFAGGGTRNFEVSNCHFDGKGLAWVAADKGCQRGVVRDNRGRNGGKPASLSAVLKDTSLATTANSLTATATLVAHAYDGQTLVDSAGTAYVITSNTTTTFTLQASGATPASGAYYVGAANVSTTRLSPIIIHSNATDYKVSDIQVLNNLLEDVVTATWTDTYESFMSVQDADRTLFRGNRCHRLNNKTTQGYAIMVHGNVTDCVIEDNEADGVANGIGCNGGDSGYTGLVIRDNRFECALAGAVLTSGSSAATETGLVLAGNYFSTADNVGTITVAVTNKWLRPVIRGNYVKGGLVGLETDSATATLLDNVVDGAATGFDYHAGGTTFAVGNQSLNCSAVKTGSGTINGGFNV